MNPKAVRALRKLRPTVEEMENLPVDETIARAKYDEQALYDSIEAVNNKQNLEHLKIDEMTEDFFKECDTTAEQNRLDYVSSKEYLCYATEKQLKNHGWKKDIDSDENRKYYDTWDMVTNEKHKWWVPVEQEHIEHKCLVTTSFRIGGSTNLHSNVRFRF